MKYAVHFHMEVDASGPLGKLLPFYKKHFFGRVLRGAAAVIALTDAQAEFLRTRYGVAPDRVYVVPNGVAEQFYLPPRISESEDGPLRLLFVGRLGAQKNVARLIEAMALTHEPVRLRIVGDGELRTRLDSQAADLGLLKGPDAKVEFRGRRDGQQLVDEYAHAQAFVLPSDREGMALVAIEAMAAGLPVIATAVPGNTELLDGVGLLAEPTPLELAAAIDRLAADPAYRAELAARSAAKAATHAWPAVLAAVEDVYDKAGL
jgi:phosphatidylinositol alpha-mannosyltransferase